MPPKRYRVEATYMHRDPRHRALDQTVQEYVEGAPAAARRAVALARGRVGNEDERRVFVHDGARTMMVCSSTIYNRQRTRSVRGRSVASCIVYNAPFKRAAKRPMKRRR